MTLPSTTKDRKATFVRRTKMSKLTKISKKELTLIDVFCKDCGTRIFSVLSDRKVPENAVCQRCAREYK